MSARGILAAAAVAAAACSLQYPPVERFRCRLTGQSGDCPEGMQCRSPALVCCPAGECCLHADCAAPNYCASRTQACKPCTFLECTAACAGEHDCPQGWACDGHGVCRPRCDLGCPAETSECAGEGLCIGCISGSCPIDMACVAEVRACLRTCEERSDCPAGRGCYAAPEGRVCAQAGTFAEGAGCFLFNDCTAGFDCVGGVCRRGPG